MLTPLAIKAKVERSVAGVELTLVPNESFAQQPSFAAPPEHALRVAQFLRDDPELRFDYASNVTGVDWLETTVKIRSKQLIEGVEREVEKTETRPGYLEAVYHLYSMALKQGPFVLRMRTADRIQPKLPSLTPVWRGAELQEREIFDLYGIVFEGHPDLRRILMWDGFQDHPMRRDYVDPDDYEYEPTPHGRVLERAKAQKAKEGGS